MASRPQQLTVHVDNGARLGPLVQIVDVLSGDHYLARAHRLEPGQCLVRGIGGDGGVLELPPARIVEGQHARRIARKGLRCRDVFEAHRRPRSRRRRETSRAPIPAKFRRLSGLRSWAPRARDRACLSWCPPEGYPRSALAVRAFACRLPNKGLASYNSGIGQIHGVEAEMGEPSSILRSRRTGAKAQVP
jgi:hypothetical protein